MTDRQNSSDSGEDPAISRLYRATRKEAPTAQLDAKILAEAEAIARRRRRRWLLPLSSAAVVLLGVSFTIKLMEQTPRLPEPTGHYDTGQPQSTDEAAVAVPQVEKSQALRMPEKPRESMSKVASPRSLGGMKATSKRSSTVSNSFDSREESEGLQLLDSDLNESAQPDIFGVEPDWLDRIEALLDAGDTAGAIQELQAFTTTYPEYPLPDRLRELLESTP